MSAQTGTLTFLVQVRYFIEKKITVFKNPNKDNSGLKERKPEGTHCFQ